MTVAAETAVRAWINSRSDLVGQPPGNPGPLGHGAYLIGQTFPSGGAFAVVSRQPAAEQQFIAEDSTVDAAQVLAQIFGGTQQAAELAAAAYASAVRTLTGSPEPMGDSGITCLIADNVTGPLDVAVPPDQGELYAFHVTADFYLRSN